MLWIGLFPTPLKNLALLVKEDEEGFPFEGRFLFPLVCVTAGRNAGITQTLFLLRP
jgi:hypothetical protein